MSDMGEVKDQVNDLQRLVAGMKSRVTPDGILGMGGMLSDIDRVEELARDLRQMITAQDPNRSSR